MSFLTREKLYLLFLAQAVVLLPVFIALPKWLVAYWGVTCFWRILILRRSLALPNLIWKVVALMLGLTGLALTFSQVLSVEVFVSFFLISYSLKTVELFQRKDALLLMSLNFICLGAGFIFYQSIFLSLYAIFALIVCVQAWIALFRLRRPGFFHEFCYAASIVFKTLPIMLVLFLTMPRLGQLWQVPSQSQTGVTGMSDSMSPGEFSNLIQSDAIAFRVSFLEQDELPGQDQRYWRSMVFDTFDGISWTRGANFGGLTPGGYSIASKPNPSWDMDYDENALFSYSILLEPHQRRWLFTLMSPVSASSNSLKLRFSQNATLESRIKVGARSEYQMTSAKVFAFAPDVLSAQSRALNTRLPAQGNERARELARSLRNRHGDGSGADLKIVDDILSLFEQSFSYTLQPRALSSDFVDNFLFESQEGFCEHFAGSFVYLMRASGVPARVVVGYQGGELNPLERYLIIRQRDAHAWAEIWLDGKGWQRIDPTAAVAPSRIQSGLSDAVDSADRALIGSGFSTNRLIAWMQLRAELLGYNWLKWVVNYDTDTQSGFFKRLLGGTEPWRIALFFGLAIASILGFYFAYNLFPRASARRYEESKAYALHLSRLENMGYVKGLDESPLQFAERVAVAMPAWREDLIRIATAFHSLAYKRSSLISQKDFALMCRTWKGSLKSGQDT